MPPAKHRTKNGSVSQRRQYANPPIQEAVVELRLVGADWDPTAPGRYHQHQRIKAEYPAKPSDVLGFETKVEQTLPEPPSITARELPRQTRFATADGKSLIHLGPDRLAINRLRPYQGWESYKSEIECALTAYVESLGPARVTRIGIRYINRVFVPMTSEGLVHLDEYFKCHPRDLSEVAEANMPSDLRGIISKQFYGWPDENRMMLTFALSEAPKDHVGFLLDLDVYRTYAPELSLDSNTVSELGTIIEDLRTKERAAFEESITDECRKLFD